MLVHGPYLYSERSDSGFFPHSYPPVPHPRILHLKSPLTALPAPPLPQAPLISAATHMVRRRHHAAPCRCVPRSSALAACSHAAGFLPIFSYTSPDSIKPALAFPPAFLDERSGDFSWRSPAR